MDYKLLECQKKCKLKGRNEKTYLCFCNVGKLNRPYVEGRTLKINHENTKVRKRERNNFLNLLMFVGLAWSF